MHTNDNTASFIKIVRIKKSLIYNRTRTTIVVSNCRYTYYQITFIKYHLSNIIYPISFIKYHLSNTFYQIPFIKCHLLNTISQITFIKNNLLFIKYHLLSKKFFNESINESMN